MPPPPFPRPPPPPALTSTSLLLTLAPLWTCSDSALKTELLKNECTARYQSDSGSSSPQHEEREQEGVTFDAVSYTHLTLPTIVSV